MNMKYQTGKAPCLIIRHSAISILLLFLPFSVWAQYYPCPQPIDPGKEGQLLAMLKNSKPDKNKVVILLNLANIYVNGPIRKDADIDRAMSLADAASKLSSQLHEVSLHNDAQLFIADMFTLQDDMKSAESILSTLDDTAKLKLLLNLSYKYWARNNGKKEQDRQKTLLFAEQSRKLSVRLHLPEYRILALNYIALAHYSQGDTSAMSELMEVVRQYKAIKYPNHLHYTYCELAIMNYVRGNPDKAEYYAMECIKNMQATGDTIAAGDFYYWRSVIAYNNEDFQKSFDFAIQAIDHFKVHSGEICIANRGIVFRMPVQALRKMKRYGEALQYVREIERDYPPITPNDEKDYAVMTGNIYRDMKAYDKAAKYFKDAFDLSKKQNKTDYDIYVNIGQLYVESGQYAKAKLFLNKIPESNRLQYTPSFMSHLHYMLFLADSATGDYRSAIKNLSDYRGFEEFNLRKAKDEEVKKLEVQYDVKEKENALLIKDQHIALLNQNSKLDEIKLKQSRLERNITIAAVLVLLTAAGIFFKQYRDKKRINLIITRDSEVISNQNNVISQKNEHLELLLREKGWLIKEVHHRVKNNLQTIISLLESQAAYLENDALKAIETSQNRIYAMSLIHQKLYQSEDIQTIDMMVYIPELIKYLKDSFDISPKIDFNVEIDQVSLDASIAIPLALIINEALTNSIKYAFPDNRHGDIFISLREQGELLKLELADNGIGMDTNSIKANPASLGLQLIKGLIKEIHGEVSFKNNHGVKITVLFKRIALEYANILETDTMTEA